jgi:hypothetical protein
MKFIKYILLLIYILFFKSLFCAYIPLETSFSDIKSDYKYYNELQELYNKQAIYPDSDWKFNPYSLINRDELVGLTMEISCNKCTKPNTSLDIMNKYKDKNQFYDVYNSNSYLYCISLAHDKSYIDSYSVWYKCDDLTYNKDKIPFCPNNYISLEESLKIILNNTNLFTKEDNDKVINDINSWIITQNLATDVFLKNTDWTPNSYYWYIKKALEYSIEEYDNLWNKKVYKLLELKDWKVYPQQLITKEEFLYMAYIWYKTNSCKNTFTNNLPLKIEIIENWCNSFDSKCDLAKINSDLFKYDFKWYASWSCDLWIDSANWYIWRLYNKTTWDEIIKYDKYINDYTFLKEWIREIYLVVIDKCYNSWEVYNTLYLTNKTILNSLDVSIDVNSIIWSNPLPISFKSIVWWWKWDYSYVWDFWNNEKANWKNVDYIYNESWIYNVLLTVKDSEWNLWSATILLKALSDWNCNEQDSDSDWISDCDDLCQLIYWKSINKWCPVLSVCNNDCSCPSWKKCNTTNEALCSIKWVCIDDNEYNSDEINNLTNTCLEKYSSKKIYWNVVCNTCPCLNFIDFTSTYRICDYLFPAITSTGSTDIFKVWESFEIN